MQPLVTAAEMRAAEAEAATRGLRSQAMMAIAGHGAAMAIMAEPGASRRRYLVLAGPGNNGGDALVVASLLRRAGARVRVATYRRAPDAPLAFPLPIPADVPDEVEPRFELTADTGLAQFRAALLACDVAIDGILGIGRSRRPEPDLAAVLAAIDDCPRRPRVIALDLPTGVDPDSGGVDGAALSADLTLTFGYAKRGLLAYPARLHCGLLRVVDLALPIPPAVAVAAHAPDEMDVRGWLPRRSPTAQKYSAGAVLALAGSPQYVGAPLLTSAAAMRAGAGYVTLATTEDTVPALAARLEEATLVPLPSHGDQGPGDDALPALQTIADRYHALLVGPGLGRAPRVRDLVMRLLQGALDGPVAAVVDADALHALSITPDWHAGVTLPLVLTPHAGEFGRLTGMRAADVEANRFAVAAEWARRWHQVVVLKGAPTVIAAPTGELCINPTGNALLATAGTGDVLSGVVAAFLAGGSAPFDAARAAVYVHGAAADLAVSRFGDRGMVAGDLLPLLPEAIRRLRDGR